MNFLQKWNNHGQNKPLTILAITPLQLSCLRNSSEGDVLESEREKMLFPEFLLEREQEKKNSEKPFRMKGKVPSTLRFLNDHY